MVPFENTFLQQNFVLALFADMLNLHQRTQWKTASEVKKPANSNKLISTSLLILLASPLFGQTTGPISFTDLSYSQALKVAREQDKYLFIDFFADWSGPCKTMEKTVFTDARVADYMNKNYISLRIDVEKQEAALVKQLKVEILPTMMFYDPQGKLLHRQEVTLTPESFLTMATQMVNLADYTKSYQRNDDNTEFVSNYVTALQWINPLQARQIAVKYLLALPKNNYVDEENWSLIKEFVVATDRTLFPRVIQNEELYNTYPSEFKAFLHNRIYKLLQLAIEKKNGALLKSFDKFIKTYPTYFHNPDSMQLAGQLAYAQEHQEDNLADLLEKYVDAYESKDPKKQAQIAYNLSQKYFKISVLEYVLRLADKSILQQPEALAYLAKALAYDRMGQFKPSYANLLLAFQYADEDMTKTLSQYETQIKKKLTYELNRGLTTIQENGGDGRFTLGVGKKRLMFGYPVPKSTSHFLVNVNGKLASNSKHLQLKGVKYMTGTMKYQGQAATPRVSVSFEFEKVLVTQTLTPVDRDGNEITTALAQFYRISYLFENLEPRHKQVGLGILFDTMIDDNDYCTIAADGAIINEERSYKYSGVPRELLFYRSKRDTSDMMGAARLSGWDATPPDQVVVGRWPILHEVSWQLRPERVPYGDSGYFLQWENKGLPQSGNLSLVTYFGLPRHKAPELRIVMEGENYLTKTENIYFEHESADLDLNAKMKITEMLEARDIIITGVLLNGYADITGNQDFNFKLSQRRIDNVGKIFAAYGIGHVPKPYGIEHATDDELKKRYGNAWDRKVEIILYYKLKQPGDIDLVGN